MFSHRSTHRSCPQGRVCLDRHESSPARESRSRVPPRWRGGPASASKAERRPGSGGVPIDLIAFHFPYQSWICNARCSRRWALHQTHRCTSKAIMHACNCAPAPCPAADAPTQSNVVLDRTVGASPCGRCLHWRESSSPSAEAHRLKGLISLVEPEFALVHDVGFASARLQALAVRPPRRSTLGGRR